VVLALHGLETDPPYAQHQTGFDAVARANGFVVVYPVGLDESWNAGSCCGPSARNQVDDVGYLAAVVADVRERLPVDRVFATGFSNGAMMALRLACERPDLLTAVAAVHGPLVTSTCDPSRPVHTMHIRGRFDLSFPYAGAPFVSALQTTVPPAPVTVATWERLNRCSGLPTVAVDGPVLRRSYPRCAGGSSVTFVVLAETAHDWPNVERDSFAGTEEIWRYFDSHRQAVAVGPVAPRLTTQIQAVRRRVPPGMVVAGHVTGRLDVVIGAPVVVEELRGGAWRTTAGGRTDIDGAFSVIVRSPVARPLRVRYAGHGLSSTDLVP
jgi:polyhydroxybutyrate depolymerase